MQSDMPLNMIVTSDKQTLKVGYQALHALARVYRKRARDYRLTKEARAIQERKARQCQIIANQLNPIGKRINATKTFRFDL